MTRAIVVQAHGGPDVLGLEEVETPEPGPGQVVVDVEVAGVNFIDVYLRTGLYPVPLPHRPGKEGAGRIVAIGDDVSDWVVGDQVAWPMGSGSYAEQCVVEASAIVRVPDTLDLAKAGAVMLQGLTAHYLATSIVSLGAGDTVLVHAGAGGTGLLLTQMLVHDDVRVLTTTGTPEKAELSLAAGAEQTFGYDDFDERSRAATDGAGLNAIIDGVGASVFDRGLGALRTRGTYIAFGNASGPIPPVDPLRLKDAGSLVLTRPSLEHFIAESEEFAWRAAEVFGAIEAGWLDVRIGATYSLADAARAHEDLEARRTTGKLLLRP